MFTFPVILGSRSPRRWELLKLLVPENRITVRPPLNADEAGFDDITTWPQFKQRILEIARVKADDVVRQSVGSSAEFGVLVADTTVVVEDDQGNKVSLGQPPQSDEWKEIVRDWFQRFYAGKTHQVLSGVMALRVAKGEVAAQSARTCVTDVMMRPDVDRWLDWYLSTNEPLGKAGGYAVQAGGSLFVTQVIGSYSNVVGLPLEETLEALAEVGIL